MSQLVYVVFETDATDPQALVQTLNQRASSAGLPVRNIQLVESPPETAEAASSTHSLQIDLQTQHGAVNDEQVLDAVRDYVGMLPPVVVKPAVIALVSDLRIAGDSPNQD